MTPSRVAIVKLGGSLASSPGLRAWLDVCASVGAGRMVIVPGGGPFADAVRALQPQQGFDDASAHRMALLAMEQFGRMLIGMHPRLVAADSASAIGYALARSEVPVWMPSAMALACADIPASWNVTSDSLAAWLASRDASDPREVSGGNRGSGDIDRAREPRLGRSRVPALCGGSRVPGQNTRARRSTSAGAHARAQ